jgi:hypothetical protein
MIPLITAQELPVLRHELFTHPNMPGAFRDQWEIYSQKLVAEGGSGGSLEDYLGSVGNVVSKAPLHYIDSRFCNLVQAAVPSLPGSPLAAHDVPSPRGFLYFSEPLLDGVSERPANWIVLWNLFDDVDHVRRDVGFIVWWMVDRETKWHRTGLAKEAQDRGLSADAQAAYIRDMPYFCPSLTYSVTFGTDISEVTATAAPGTAGWLLRFLLVTWHLQRQRLTSSHVVRPSRATLRRLARLKTSADPEVRVLTLRVPESGNHGPDSESSHEYYHQWIVRGHWRQQWYPSIEDHRPVWIAPHLKGPDGAPLLGGEKVYAWRR